MKRYAFLYSAKHESHLNSLGDFSRLCAALEDGSHRQYTEAIDADTIDAQPCTEHFGDLVFLGYGQICKQHRVYRYRPEYRQRMDRLIKGIGWKPLGWKGHGSEKK
jgi:hypothetical protein